MVVEQVFPDSLNFRLKKNGAVGHIQDYHPKTDNCVVQIKGGGAVLVERHHIAAAAAAAAVPAAPVANLFNLFKVDSVIANLFKGDSVIVKGLQSRTDLNGKKGKIIGFNKNTGRFGVSVFMGNDGETNFAFKPENLELANESK